MLQSTVRTLAPAFTLALFATASLAQTPSPCAVAMAGSVMMYGPSPKTNAPFSATIQTTREQKLANGNAIHGLIVTHAYRDSVGRVRSETSTPCSMGVDGQFRPAISVTVTDPVTRSSMSWQINGRDKVVHIRHQPDPQSVTPGAPQTQTQTEEQRKVNALVQEHWRKNTRHEQLGTRTIAGVPAEGSKQITTTPAGEQGNDLPVENAIESWIAHGPEIAVLSIQDDPGRGHIVTEVTELSLTEPDASVFAPPAGYTLEDQATKPASSGTGQ